MVEWSPPTSEIRCSNPNIGKVLSTNCKLNRKDENKEKEVREWPIFKKEKKKNRNVVGSGFKLAGIGWSELTLPCVEVAGSNLGIAQR